jgi:hypothetical protein
MSKIPEQDNAKEVMGDEARAASLAMYCPAMTLIRPSGSKHKFMVSKKFSEARRMLTMPAI